MPGARRARRHPPGAPTIGAVSAAAPTDPAGTVRPSAATGPAGHRRTRPHPRRPGRGGRALGLLVRLLAGRGRLGRGPGGEEGVPPGEDVRRRPHPPLGAPDRRHGDRGSPGRRPPLLGSADPRLRQGPRPGLARAPELPLVRLRHHPPRSRRHRQRAGRQGRGHRVAGDRGGRTHPRATGTGPSDGGAGSCGRRSGHRAERCPPVSGPWSRTRPPGRPVRSGPGTWWWPTGPTRASAGPSARRGTGANPWAWPCAGYYTLTRARPALHRVPPRHPGRRRQGGPRLRLDLPAGRRPGQRGGRACSPPTGGGRA